MWVLNVCCNVQRDKSVLSWNVTVGRMLFFQTTDLLSLLLCTNLNNSVALAVPWAHGSLYGRVRDALPTV